MPVLVLGSGGGAGWCCELAVRGGERLVVLVPGAGAGAGDGAGAVSWLCACIDTLQVLFWPTAVSRAVLFARILLYV